MTMRKQILYLSHGGGPLPLLGDEGHQEMVAQLTEIANCIPKPSAILVISAHWEADVPTLTAAPNPDLIYDYYGFPPESYHITYPAQGEPVLAQEVYKNLAQNGFKPELHQQRGLDHGVFIPLKIMYPQADIPCVQLSLVKGLDPDTHIKMGQALQNLEYDNLLIIGSGFSFHNMQAFFASETAETKSWNEAFEAWLLETCSCGKLTPDERLQRLSQWQQAPSARYCHPREEHLLPLHVCCGLANAPCSKSFELSIIGKKSSMYYWSVPQQQNSC